MKDKLFEYIKYNKETTAKILVVTTLVFIGIIAGIGKSDSDEIIIEKDSLATNATLPSETAIEALEYIYVDISGEVKKPGVKKLEANARVYQAIEVSGGLNQEADVSAINMAAKLMDEDKIYIPKLNEKQAIESVAFSHVTTGIQGNDLVNINKATSEQLQELSGVGPSTADKIIQYREDYAGFKSIEDIKNISGIGDKTFAKFKDKICI